jgi:hypothetical protein
MLPTIRGLECGAWQKTSKNKRWSALQEMERQLAAQEDRPAARVLPMPAKMRQLGGEGEPKLLGRCVSNGNKSVVYLDPSLVADSLSYRAVETLLHEARHAYQDHAITHPGYHEDNEQVERWRINNEPNVHVDFDVPGADPRKKDKDYSMYRFQEVENDATLIARGRCDEIFERQFRDASYAKYRTSREQEMTWDRKQAIDTLLTKLVEDRMWEIILWRYQQVEQARQKAAPSQPGADKEHTGESFLPADRETPTGKQAGHEAAKGQEPTDGESQATKTREQATPPERTTRSSQPESKQQVAQPQKTIEAQPAKPEQWTKQPQRNMEAEGSASQQKPMPSQNAQQTPMDMEASTAAQTWTTEDAAVSQQAVDQSAGESAEQAVTESAGQDSSGGEAASKSEGYDYGYGY